MVQSKKRLSDSSLLNVDVFIGGAPLLEIRLCEGLLRFGESHPNWRFSLRGADFRYTGKWLSEHSLAGVLVLVDSKGVSESLEAAGIPWVHLLPPEPVERASVSVDDYAIGRMAAECFLGKGFLRCAFCGVGTRWSDERRNGFVDCLRESGRGCDSVDFPFDEDGDWAVGPAYEKKLSNWISTLRSGVAIFAAHDSLANRIVDAALRLGMRVPNDIAVLGVGNHDMLCRLSPVPISSIDASVPSVAVRGAEMLAEMIAGKNCSKRVLVSPLPVVERDSTRILAYADDLVVNVVEYIRTHFAESISAGSLSARFNVSHKVLTRRFAKYVGHSPAAEIRATRLRMALRMLETTSLSLSEIAYSCGYADLSHMHKVFREKLNLTPKRVRLDSALNL